MSQSVAPQLLQGPHLIGTSVMHLVVPGARYRLVCGKDADNGVRWCWCQLVRPGQKVESGQRPILCAVCVHFARAKGLRL